MASQVSSETRLQRCKRLLKNAQQAYGKECAALRRMCLPCQAKDMQRELCDGRPGEQCSQCEPDECEWPPHAMASFTILDFAADNFVDWDRPISTELHEQMMELTRTHQLDPEPEEEHFLCIFTARMSSHQGQDILLQIMHGLVMTQNRYDNLLNGPLLNNVPEGQRPGGQNTPLRSYRQVIARHGGRRVPIRLGNLNDPFLITFVHLMHNVTAPNNPNIPIEIHLVNLGLAGFAVDITAYGDRKHGFFKFILDRDAANGTNIADRIYIVTIAEPHVVDGLAIHALDHPNPSPHWQGHRNKYLVKHRLADLIDRWAFCVPLWVQNHRIAHINQANPNLPPIPLVPIPVWNQPDSTRLDPFLKALFDELAWLSALLDNTTTPSDNEVHARNRDRNEPMQ